MVLAQQLFLREARHRAKFFIGKNDLTGNIRDAN